MEQTTIQIINGDDYWERITDIIEAAVSKIYADSEADYITTRQASNRIGRKTASTINNWVKVGKRDMYGQYHRLEKYYPYGNNTPMYKLSEVLRIKNIK